jgi:hypothetical protein
VSWGFHLSESILRKFKPEKMERFVVRLSLTRFSRYLSVSSIQAFSGSFSDFVLLHVEEEAFLGAKRESPVGFPGPGRLN